MTNPSEEQMSEGLKRTLEILLLVHSLRRQPSFGPNAIRFLSNYYLHEIEARQRQASAHMSMNEMVGYLFEARDRGYVELRELPSQGDSLSSPNSPKQYLCRIRLEKMDEVENLFQRNNFPNLN